MNKTRETTKEAKLESVAENQVSKVKDEFNNLPVKDQEEIVGSNHILMESLEISRSYSGPLPPPAIFAEYNKAIPDAAERIMRMAEKEQDARINMNDYEARKTVEASKRAQWMGFSMSLLCLCASFALLFLGKSGTGLITLGASALTIIASTTSSHNNKNLEKTTNNEEKEK